MCTNLLKTAVWNIEGLTTDKINDPHFNKIISQFQIISFIETWTNDVDVNEISIPGFCFVDSNNRKKHHKARRNSGGINIFAKNSISKGIKKLPKYHTDILWIKIDHNFFKLDKDIYIATVYMSPESSSTNTTGLEPIYDKLLADVVKYSNLGHIIVQGDFNAYTNTKPDFIAFDNSCTSNQDDLQYISDQNIPRNNLDTKLVNNSGKYLLNLCKESSLRILNGRTIGDLHDLDLDVYVNMKKINTKKDIFSELYTCEKDPKMFWNILNKLSRQKSNNKENESLPQEDFIQFYKKLNNCDINHNSFHSKIIKDFDSLKEKFNLSHVTDDLTHLSSEITIEEIVTAIRLIKNGKSTSADMISNEMLKMQSPS
ncbi:unnamed protein product [Mytilus edulis]|uniref:Endonuclease/exonuclease/phosphatase domain-containing protein n=1 Tax=Mytilus edulis TaxID=6550 RepID=A0A8S3RCC7_MYTED|nr:unnamed protein product [Mytilus edulis]